jgi:hypothetical protein
MKPCARLRAHLRKGGAVRDAKQALTGPHRRLIAFSASCSVDLDGLLADEQPQAARWDYLLADEATCLGMEVHPAKSTEVELILRKKQWAEKTLAGGPAVTRWCWIVPAASRLQFTAISPAARRLAKGGVEFPRRRLE